MACAMHKSMIAHNDQLTKNKRKITRCVSCRCLLMSISLPFFSVIKTTLVRAKSVISCFYLIMACILLCTNLHILFHGYSKCTTILDANDVYRSVGKLSSRRLGLISCYKKRACITRKEEIKTV